MSESVGRHEGMISLNPILFANKAFSPNKNGEPLQYTLPKMFFEMFNSNEKWLFAGCVQ